MFSQFMNGMGGMGGAPGMAEEPEVPDTAEKVHISGLSLLKMLKHGSFLFFLCAKSPPSTPLTPSFLATFRSSRRAYGGYGPHAGPIRGRLHHYLPRRFRHASARHRFLLFFFFGRLRNGECRPFPVLFSRRLAHLHYLCSIMHSFDLVRCVGRGRGPRFPDENA